MNEAVLMDTAHFLHQGPTIHRRNTEVTALVDGVDFLRAIDEAIARTQGPGDLIHILAWRFDPQLDLRGRRFGEPGFAPIGALLAEKAARGVDVRVILDGSVVFSNFPPPGLTFLPRIAGHRDNALAARALRRWRVPGVPLPPLAGRVLVDWSGAFFGSHHQKATLVASQDDASAFVGGIDFWSNRLDAFPHDRLSDPQGGRSGWHDAGIQVRGRAVTDVWSNFSSRWREARTLPRRMRFWVPSPLGTDPFIDAEGDPSPLPRLAELPSSASVQILRSRYRRKHRLPPPGPPWTFPPHGGIYEVFHAMVHGIRHAARYIYVEDQFLGDNPFRHEEFSIFPHLREAAGRGVKLILTTSGKSRPERASSNDVNTRLNNDLERYLVKKLPPAARNTIAVYRIASLTVHSKIVLIDDRLAVMGSANLQSRSMDGQDFELSVAVEDTGTWVRDLRVRLWAEHLRVRVLDPELKHALCDLDLALGIWRPEWLPPRASETMWQKDGDPPGFHPFERVLGFVGPEGDTA